MRRLLIILTLFWAMACRKTDAPLSLSTSNLTGTWKLLTYCKPGGTITCNPVTVPSDKGVFISFSKKKEFNEYYQNTKPMDYAFLGCGGGSYEIENQNIRIRASCMSSSNGQVFSLVSLTDKRLVLNPFGSGDYVFEKQ